jgi:tetratricopeptide (TPR) repeat protein
MTQTKIDGIFRQEREAKIGTGGTAKSVKQDICCLAKQINDEEIEVRYLNQNDEPVGEAEVVKLNDFLNDFSFLPYYRELKEAEKEKNINKKIATAEEHIERDELHSAEYEYDLALKIDEEHLRANFGIGNLYFKMGQPEKAKDVFIKLSKIDAIFEKTNKHLFNECGMNLRQQNLFDEAIAYYEKAVEICGEDDENIFFNLARAYFSKGDLEKAQESISRALLINPEFTDGKAFVKYMEQKSSTLV